MAITARRAITSHAKAATAPLPTLMALIVTRAQMVVQHAIPRRACHVCKTLRGPLETVACRVVQTASFVTIFSALYAQTSPSMSKDLIVCLAQLAACSAQRPSVAYASITPCVHKGQSAFLAVTIVLIAIILLARNAQTSIHM